MSIGKEVTRKISSRSSLSTTTVVEISEKHVFRRIDKRVLPILFGVYFIQFMDKVILNYANLMTLRHDVGMTGDQFSWAGTAFFLGYLVSEFPQGT